jgi:hypothetical protein
MRLTFCCRMWACVATDLSAMQDNMELLIKPFEADALLRKVRIMLAA